MNRRFDFFRTQAISAVEHELRSTITQPEPPPGLAEQLQTAIRAQPHSTVQPSGLVLPWLLAPAFALAVTLLVCWRFGQTATTPGVERATDVALDLSQGLTHNLPANMVDPLSQEWGNLHRDLDKTTQFLEASLP